jgi:hypothetical protein
VLVLNDPHAAPGVGQHLEEVVIAVPPDAERADAGQRRHAAHGLLLLRLCHHVLAQVELESKT